MYRRLDTIDTLVVHCTDSPDGVPVTIWEVDEWHRLRGFRRDPGMARMHQSSLLHFGYHRLYGVNGAVFDGRALDEVGAHVLGHNTNSIGVCLVGRGHFTAEQWESLRLDVDIFLRRWPGLRVGGHRDFDLRKTCPNFDVGEWLAGGMQPLVEHLFTPEAP